MTRLSTPLGVLVFFAALLPLVARPTVGQDSQQAIGGNAPGVLQAPFPALPAAHQAYLDQVLNYWEQSSSKIKRYRCKFTRWQYDPVFGPGFDPKSGLVPAKTIATGILQYAEPDKGMYELEKIYDYAPPAKPGDEPRYQPREGEAGEKWICDGESVFEFDFTNKRLVDRQLPPEIRGTTIADGPLPFVFGAQADKIKQRYWVRIITPPNAKGEYWLEAYPKTQRDAANFKKVEVIIDEKDFLPKAIQIFDRNFEPRTNPSRTAFTFEEREINWNVNFEMLNIFFRAFYKPATPSGWKREVHKYEEPIADNTRVSLPQR